MACRLVLVPGSLRTLSTNAAVLRTAQQLAPAGADVVLYDRLGHLPHFNIDDDTSDGLPVEVAALRATIREAEGLLFSTPEYAGALPGSFKNLLDWAIGDADEHSIYAKPVAWINASTRGARGAHEELRVVLGYAHATIIDKACVDIAVAPAMVGADGLVSDPVLRRRIASAIGLFARELNCVPYLAARRSARGGGARHPERDVDGR